MQTKYLLLRIILIAVLGLSSSARLLSQTFTSLHSFTGGSGGANPCGGLVLSGTTLYGAASTAGSGGNGAIFAVNIDGSGFTNLYSFPAYAGSANGKRPAARQQGGLIMSGDELASPQAGLVLSGNILYGTTHKGGISDAGMVFGLNNDGSGFTNLHSFTGNDGAEPQAGLVLSGNFLFGTTRIGGSKNAGTVFVLNTDGTRFSNLYSFSEGKDGAFPQAGLIISGNTLYGTANCGRKGAGTVFAINTDGSGFRTIHSFSGYDGAWPEAGLSLSGSTLHGTTFYGGIYGGDSNKGIVFSLNTIGLFTNLHSFAAFDRGLPLANSAGARPQAELILSGKSEYGTTYQGGNSGCGIIFKLNDDGSGFTNLYSFTGGKDGAGPQGKLILSDRTLYGTTVEGGNSGRGSVFRLSLGK